jgi:cytochrome P450
VDVISEYAFPKGYCLLDKPEFDSENYKAWMALSRMGPPLKQFGWLYPMLSAIPPWVTKYTSPETYLVVRELDHLYQEALTMERRRGNYEIKELVNRPSMLEAFMDSDLPESQKTAKRIASKAQTAIGAGTLTSSRTLKNATYHILDNSPILERLMRDLEEAIPDSDNPSNFQQLEQIPYLVAIFYESLRNVHAVSQRLQRIFPDYSLQYKEWVIPPGTPVSMTSVHVHNNPDIFPETYKLRPERWLPLHTEGQRLQK